MSRFVFATGAGQRLAAMFRGPARWRLSTRLWFGFGLVLAMVVAIAVIALWRMQRIDALSTAMVEQNDRRVEVAQTMMNAVSDVSVGLIGVALVVDDADGQEQDKRLAKALGDYQQARKAFEAVAGSGEATKKSLAAIDKLADEGVYRVEQLRTQLQNGGSSVANVVRARDPRPLQQEWVDQLARLVAQEREAGRARHDEAVAEYNAARRTVIGATALAALLAALVATLILRSVTRPLAAAVAHAQRIAEGDLTGEIDASRDDETGELLAALATMQGRLGDLVGQIREAAASIELASREIAQGNADLSGRTEQTAADLQATASSMSALRETVSAAAHSAQQADGLARNVADAARRGGDQVERLVQTMDEILASAQRIAEINAVIDGIAFQTNILSLNAAVEAASAGESGRGFAVVAAEVRNLAQRTSGAAQDIKSLVDRALGNADQGARQARDAGSSIRALVNGVLEVASTVSAASQVSDDQAGRIQQVHGAVERLDGSTQRNAALVEQSAAAAQAMLESAERLVQMVRAFKSR